MAIIINYAFMVILLSIGTMMFILPLKGIIQANRAGAIIHQNSRPNQGRGFVEIVVPIALLMNIIFISKYGLVEIVTLFALALLILGSVMDTKCQKGQYGELREKGFFTFFRFIRWEQINSYEVQATRNKFGHKMDGCVLSVQLNSGRKSTLYCIAGESEMREIFNLYANHAQDFSTKNEMIVHEGARTE